MGGQEGYCAGIEYSGILKSPAGKIRGKLKAIIY